MQNKLRAMMDNQGISNKELSIITNMDKRIISKILRGETRIWPGWQKKIADALGVPIGELFENDSRCNEEYKYLKEVIYSKGLTIRQVAHSCNMASQSLTSAINGNIPFYQGWKRRVADALGESVEDLFSEGKQR